MNLRGDITLRARRRPRPPLAPGDRVAVSTDGIHIFDESQEPAPPPDSPPPGAILPQRMVIPR